jgi:leucyl-tRNA synthetase
MSEQAVSSSAGTAAVGSDPEVPPYRYNVRLANEIEARWQDRWEAEGTFHAPNPAGPLGDPERVAGRDKLFLLDMFPYPSGAGLHVGHPLGYIGTDVYGRFQRMIGRNVLHAMGFDAFGLPAEQYAVQTGQHPRVTTEANIERYRAQLRQLGLAHDARRSVATIDPGYVRWTQWIFLQIFNSWYDADADGGVGGGKGRARHVDELVAEYAKGSRPTPDGRPWSELSDVERRRFVDGQRLAYRAEAPVNWCPGMGTVLANEEITAEGRSAIGNFPVHRRNLTQWMMRITAYADRLIDDLDRLEWPDSIKLMQRNWIGRSSGATITFATRVPGAATGAAATPSFEVFTTRPDTLFGCTYMVLAPEHPLVETLTAPRWPDGAPASWTGGHASPAEAVAAYRRQAEERSEVERTAESRHKTGVFTGAYAVNPATGAEVPVFIADYVLMGYGTGAIMAVPGQDERDWEFAEEYELPIVRTVQPPADFDGKAYVGEGPAINSANDEISLNGLDVAEAKQAMNDWLASRGHGSASITYRLRDWLFSRQRYWGEPFPIVYDETDLPIALPDSALPVDLPEVEDYSPKSFDPDDRTSEPVPPLSRATEWAKVTLDLGDGPKTYRRELNVMPQWAGSCWYELRYLDPTNDERLVDPDVERYWMGKRAGDPRDPGGVDLYVGGVEHAVLHLLYARFWHKVLYDLGHVSSDEPYRRLVNQGYIQAYAYTDVRGAYVPAEEVEEVPSGGYTWRGEPVVREYGKMGKSLKNVVTPDEMCATYGADTFRVYEMSTGPLETSRPWETRAVVGSHRFLQRVWRLVVDERTGAGRVVDAPADEEIRRLLHRTIDGVRTDMAALRFNTAIAKLIELTNGLTSAGGAAGGHGAGTPREAAEPLVQMVAPFAPHLAEELWSRMGHGETVTYEPFPEADPALLVDETIELPVQVNGKVRGRITVSADAGEADVRAAALASPRVAAAIADREPRKVIVVPGRMVSVVL